MVLTRRGDNRDFWNAASDAYQAAHGQRLGEHALAWFCMATPFRDVCLDPATGTVGPQLTGD